MSLRKILRCRRAASAIEYGLIAGFIAIPIITAVTGIGGKLATTFTNIAARFTL